MRTVKIELKKEKAFAIFAVLARYAYDGKFEIHGLEEERALKLLYEAFDDELVETFRDDYKTFVAESKRSKKIPNQAPEPTSTAVTPPADAGDRASGTRGSS